MEMFTDVKVLFGVSAVVIGLIAFVPYLYDIYKGKTKPHIFTWFVWALVYAITFIAQVSEGAGAGAWFTAAETTVCFLIVAAAFFRGEKVITVADKVSFALALGGVLLWVVLQHPLYAVLAAVVSEVLAFTPTFRKAFHKPLEETESAFALAAIAVLLSLLALEEYSVTTWLYPATILVTNTAFVSMILIRKKQLYSPRTNFQK